jgi:hypothetical protein
VANRGKTMGTNKKLALSVAAAAVIAEDNKKKKEARNAKSKNRKK